jgi:site-specific DNA-methyltransferase (adenine-specific)
VPRATYDRGEDLETHAYAFIHSDDIKARLTELFGGTMQFDVVDNCQDIVLKNIGHDIVQSKH